MADRILRIQYGEGVSAEKRFKSVVTYLKQLIEDGLRDEYVRRKAVDIVTRAGVKGHDELGEIRAIVKWVQTNVTYRKDPQGVEYFMSARRILKDVEQGRSAADCDDFVIVAAALLGSIGYSSGALIVDSNADGVFNHVMLMTRTTAPTKQFGNKWIPCELIFPTFKIGKSVKISTVYPLVADAATKRVPVMMQQINGLSNRPATSFGSSPSAGLGALTPRPIVWARNLGLLGGRR
jgi:predicted transglutaminase-like cysteine proteinase